MHWGRRFWLMVCIVPRPSATIGPLQLRVVFGGGESTGRWERVIRRFLELFVLLSAWRRYSLQASDFLEFSSLFFLQLGLFGVLKCQCQCQLGGTDKYSETTKPFTVILSVGARLL